MGFVGSAADFRLNPLYAPHELLRRTTGLGKRGGLHPGSLEACMTVLGSRGRTRWVEFDANPKTLERRIGEEAFSNNCYQKKR